MLKKYGIGLIVVVIAGMAAAFTTPTVSHKPTTDTLYKFVGTHHQESMTSKWEVISSPSDFPCNPGNDKGCRITSSSNVGGHPSSVPVDANDLPIVQSPTTSRTNSLN